ncbi:phospholipase C/P1 nuclease domain-containing protein [Ampelomyces quisqualis]|uniref:Phospholipase C/P1 nuclease domain-containing protein n=1 Tax=Ampelomyces quisqualis TaxID=50730 RepID=A0A6A5QEX8_AMPQU|nr:phospholipase C/P1 nuclease domain-containing protein [Ampelomyces quisqualis]
MPTCLSIERAPAPRRFNLTIKIHLFSPLECRRFSKQVTPRERQRLQALKLSAISILRRGSHRSHTLINNAVLPKMKLTTFTLLATAANPASSWGTDVHNQIGHLATALLSPSTTTLLTSLLSNTTLGAAASWADAYAHTPEGHFSYQWHWIDTHDNPPHTCRLDFEQDCAKGGCVVSAIGNQTRILTACVRSVVKNKGVATRGQPQECEMALKWLLHFLGDIHQPLHASGHAQGGNGVNVTFNGLHTQLHAVRRPTPPPGPKIHLLPYSHLDTRSSLTCTRTRK